MATLPRSIALAPHPGHLLQDWMESMLLHTQDIAQETGLSPIFLREFIDGYDQLTPEIAASLSRLTGQSIAYWIRAQTLWDISISRSLTTRTQD